MVDVDGCARRPCYATVVGRGAFVALAFCAALTPLLFTSSALEACANRQLVYQLAVVGIGLLALVSVACGNRLLLTSRLLMPVGMFLLTHLASVALCPFKAIAVHELWRVSLLGGLFLLAATLVADRRRRVWLCHALLLSALAISVYAVMQKLEHDPVAWSSGSAERVFSTIGNPNMLAGYCVVVLPLLFFMGLSFDRGWLRGVYFIVFALLLITFYLTLCGGGRDWADGFNRNGGADLREMDHAEQAPHCGGGGHYCRRPVRCCGLCKTDVLALLGTEFAEHGEGQLCQCPADYLAGGVARQKSRDGVFASVFNERPVGAGLGRAIVVACTRTRTCGGK